MKKMKDIFVAGMLLSTVVACSEPQSKVVNLHSACKTAVVQEQFKLDQEKNVILKMGAERIEISNLLIERERVTRESTMNDPLLQINVAETAESLKAIDLEINDQFAPLVKQRELTKTAISNCDGVDSDALNKAIDESFDEVVGQVAGVVIEGNFAEESADRLTAMLEEETQALEALKNERAAVTAFRQDTIDESAIPSHSQMTISESTEAVKNIKKMTEMLEKLDTDILLAEEKVERLSQGSELAQLVFAKKAVTEKLDSEISSDLEDVETAGDLNAYLDRVKSLQGEREALNREIEEAK